MLSDSIDWMKRVVTEPRSELTRWQRRARFSYDLSRHGARKLHQDNAPQMAGALAFRTLFGLLPVLIVGTILVRAFQGTDQLQVMLGTFFGWLFQEPAGSAPDDSISAWMMDLVSRAQEINLTALGWAGSAVLVYSAVGLMVTIEGAFNKICRASEGRSWARRLPVYWMLLTLGPMAIGATLFANAQFEGLIESLTSWQWALGALRAVWGFSVLWLFMLAAFRLMPATSVALRPAMVGAFVCALMLTIGQQFLGAYLNSMQSIKLWGSVGLIPLFMFWVYMMWLAVLFGLEVAAALQLLHGRRIDEIDRLERSGGVVDPAVIVSVMQLVAGRFTRGESTTLEWLAGEVGLGERTVQVMLDGLAEAGLVHRVSASNDAVTLARPPDKIGLDELIEVGFQLVDSGQPSTASPMLEGLRAAQRSFAAERTLAEACS
jgi:membrane protein